MRVWKYALFLAALPALSQNSAQEFITQGVQLFRDAKYAEAASRFEQAVRIDPFNAGAHLYLGTAYMVQVVPGADTAENRLLAGRAEAEFRRVVELQPENSQALQSLASLAYNQKRWDDATAWNQKLIEADPGNKAAYYSLGVIAWSRFYPEYAQARQKAGMRPQDPGPLTDIGARIELRNRFSAIIESGLKNLAKALELDPDYSDAMAYTNLLVRERADLRDSDVEYRADLATADDWVRRALDAKRRGSVSGGPPPPPPPPGLAAAAGVQRIRVEGPEQAKKLIESPAAEYPPLARQARVQGTVRYAAIVDRDGRLKNLQLISGHPLLVQAATEAVKRYVYQPTFVNGQPVEVWTEIAVSFTIGR